jgi:hypothetical protein
MVRVRRWISLACGLSFAAACADLGGLSNTTSDAGVTTDGQPLADASGGGADHALGEASNLTCSDGVQNGTETDIDCGGECPPCAVGKHCDVNGSCGAGICAKGICCETAKYRRSSGLGSGAIVVCCQGGDTRLSTCDCGIGAEHRAVDYDASCGEGYELSGNGGSSCAEVECQGLNCDPNVDAGHIEPTTCN